MTSIRVEGDNRTFDPQLDMMSGALLSGSALMH
jgi:hypothetical protein